MTSRRYQVGGSLDISDVNYVVRESDIELYKALDQGEFCYVLNSRQMGKSSLLVRTKYKLEQSGFRCAALDFTGIGRDSITPEQWYKGIVSQLYLGFNLVGKFNLKEWWVSREDISLVQKLNDFIINILLVEYLDEQLVIFIDEVDSILGLPFSSDDFFTFIHFCYNQRAILPIYKRINFAIFGVATPSSLVRDKRITPFNIGKSIQLHGFSLNQSRHLLARDSLSSEQQKLALHQILQWTNGQPFLTQKLCQLLEDCLEYDEYHHDLVEEIVENKIISNWQSQDEPEHLRTISNRVLNNEITSIKILGVYQQILLHESIPRDNSIEQVELLLSGIVIESQGFLAVKNIIYQKVFNLNWVENRLNELRPYYLQLKKWLNSHRQDTSQLLQNETLKQALIWANHKKLADLDYQFLGAAQELAKQQVEQRLDQKKIARQKIEIALQAATTAINILAKVKQETQKKVASFRLSIPWLIKIIFAATVSIILLRQTSYLQNWELTTFDQFMRSRPSNPIEQRITIIGINEQDIQTLKSYPISDQILATAINNLKSNQPRVIGLDIYRDLPVLPGTQKLKQVFKNTENLWGIEKVIGNQVNPSPQLAKLDRVGFNDLVLDRDGKIRRALLSFETNNGKIKYSFPLQLALQYLAKLKIKPQPVSPNNHQIKLGKAAFNPLKSNDGGYINAKNKGYQILLNYRGTQRQFLTYSLQDLLANKIPKSAIGDRLVIIGVTATSINDSFVTPYSEQKLIPGVYIHANIISHLLTAALTGKGLFKMFPEFK